jgi:hypothetical protein
MQFTDIFSFSLSILGFCGFVCGNLRFLIPRNLLPDVSAVLTEAEHLLDRAESAGVVPRSNEYRSALTLYKVVMPLPMDGHLTGSSQLFQSIPAHPDGKSSCFWNITATSACCSVRSNVQAVYTLVASRGNQNRDQGSLNTLLSSPQVMRVP